jgi:hypothetical protein
VSNHLVVRSFEIVVLVAYVATLLWVWAQRNPLYLGTLLAGMLCFVFDWAWCARSVFNVTFNPDLVPLPGITTQGVSYPAVLLPAWGLAFGFTTILLVRAAPLLDRRLGALGYAIVWLMGGIGMTGFENLLVSGLHIYNYHLRPEFLAGAVPYSNILLSGNIQLLCYVLLRWTQKWSALPEHAGIHLGREVTWKGLVLGAVPLWGAFVIAFVVQLFWYAWAEPWTESGRPF